MFKINKIQKALTGVLLVICALGVATSAFGRSVKDVKMEMVNDKLVVISKKNENGCTWGWTTKRGPGCIKVTKNDKADIDFKLTGDTKCGLEYGTNWELNALYLGGYNESNKPDAPGFGNTDQVDFDKVSTDFHGVDKDSGLVLNAKVDPSKISAADENGNEYVVWYTIKAICKRTDDGEAYKTFTDPRIRNGGTD